MIEYNNQTVDELYEILPEEQKKYLKQHSFIDWLEDSSSPEKGESVTVRFQNYVNNALLACNTGPCAQSTYLSMLFAEMYSDGVYLTKHSYIRYIDPVSRPFKYATRAGRPVIYVLEYDKITKEPVYIGVGSFSRLKTYASRKQTSPFLSYVFYENGERRQSTVSANLQLEQQGPEIRQDNLSCFRPAFGKRQESRKKRTAKEPEVEQQKSVEEQKTVGAVCVSYVTAELFRQLLHQKADSKNVQAVVNAVTAAIMHDCPYLGQALIREADPDMTTDLFTLPAPLCRLLKASLAWLRLASPGDIWKYAGILDHHLIETHPEYNE